jgi:hypothetical protein
MFDQKISGSELQSKPKPKPDMIIQDVRIGASLDSKELLKAGKTAESFFSKLLSILTDSLFVQRHRKGCRTSV